MKNISYIDKISFESYGMKIAVRVNDARALEKVKEIIPVNSRIIENEDSADHNFSLVWGEDETKEDALYQENEEVARRVDVDRMIALLESRLRMAIGEFAPRHVFIHAGVVGWNGRALIFPAKSLGGKTTLVAELIKMGAVYYSDEYAVLDENGLAHPYPKPLSIRKEGEYQQTDRPVEELGGVRGIEPIPVGLVLLTGFEPGASWSPKILSQGQGLMELLPHALALRHNPEFVFKVLNLITKHAIIASSNRGDVSQFASLILNFAN